jgi:hypothetical protein
VTGFRPETAFSSALNAPVPFISDCRRKTRKTVTSGFSSGKSYATRVSVQVFHRETNANEEWLELNDDESVTYHIENSGWPMMKAGISARETELTMDAAKLKWPNLADAIDKALQTIRSHRDK